MPDQKTLPLSVDHDLSKWPRLAYCLDFIRRNGEVNATTLGAAWRLHRQTRWPYPSPHHDRENGNAIGKALYKRGLVTYSDRDGQRWWRAVIPGTKKAWREPDPEPEWPF